MSNLTQSKKVAREVSLDPIPGHTLVVYKRSGGSGKSFFIELNPEQQFTEEKKNWWQRFTSDPPSYIAYAVNRNEALKLVISRLLLTSHGRACDLIISVEYHVSAPRRVADRYDDDPLTLLEEAIFDSLKDGLANSDWDDIKRRFATVAEDALINGRAKIDRRADNLGFAIESIKLERQLHQKDLKELEAEDLREQMQVEQEKQRIEHEAAMHRNNLEHVREVNKVEQEGYLQHKKVEQEGALQFKKLEQEGALQDKTLEQQASRLAIQNTLDAYEQRKRLNDGVVDSSVKALDITAGNIDSIAQLEAGHRAFGRMARGIGGVDGSGGGSGASGVAGIGEAPRYGALTEGTGASGSLPKVVDLLTRTLHAIEDAGLASTDKNRLLSVLLHLTAESLLGREADAARLEGYETSLQDVTAELGYYPPELERFIRDNYRALKERLE
jgi:hypothetical protein